MRTFRSCPAQFALENFLYKPATPDHSGFAAAVGDACHAAWQTWLVTRDLEQAQAMLAIQYPWDHPFPDTKRPFWRAMDLLLEVIEHPYSQYDLLYVDDGSGEPKPAIELAVRLIVPTEYLDVHYTGYIDAVVIDPISGLPLILDLKTTGMRQDAFLPSYTYDTQLTGYGIIVSALVNGGKMGCTLKGAYIGAYTMATGDPYITAVDKVFDKDEALAFIYDIYQFAAQVHQFQQAGRFPRNPAHCMQYGRPCKHLGAGCEARSLAQMQRNMDPLMREDYEYTSFKPQFSVTYNEEHFS